MQKLKAVETEQQPSPDLSRFFQVIKDCPIPPRRRGGSSRKGISKYPFAEMEVGDAFDAPRVGERTKWGQDRTQANIARSANIWAKRNAPGKKFTVRIVSDDAVRCWRVA